jgi:hypothetical protein
MRHPPPQATLTIASLAKADAKIDAQIDTKF